jgi:hypothetical protein
LIKGAKEDFVPHLGRHSTPHTAFNEVVTIFVGAASCRNGIVAGANSAEVALAAKAESHSHKGDTSSMLYEAV